MSQADNLAGHSAGWTTIPPAGQRFRSTGWLLDFAA